MNEKEFKEKLLFRLELYITSMKIMKEKDKIKSAWERAYEIADILISFELVDWDFYKDLKSKLDKLGETINEM